MHSGTCADGDDQQATVPCGWLLGWSLDVVPSHVMRYSFILSCLRELLDTQVVASTSGHTARADTRRA